jgi:muramoyltetrapeptide carboxypeptidase LdcA involved in peptidoglycan recycling
MEFKQPSPLKSGDKVAIISPSSGLPFIFPWVYEQGIDRLRKIFHLEPVEYPTARQSPQYLSQNPQARADDINKAFADPSIKAVIATIGGNDQIRILPYLDPKIILANPKIFMGYSDCTNMHLFLWNLGITSYYGGAIMTQLSQSTVLWQTTSRRARSLYYTSARSHQKRIGRLSCNGTGYL